MQLRLILLLALASCLHAATLMAPRYRRVSPLRIRGGFLDDLDENEEELTEDEPAPEPAVPAVAAADGSVKVPPNRALSRREIVEKLNEVPVFCIVNEDGGVVGMRPQTESGEAGKAAVCWFTDALEARALLEAAQKSAPEATLRLACHGMGSVFTQCGGWGAGAEGEGTSPPSAAVNGESVDLKLQGSHKLVQDTSPQLRELLAQQGLDAGCWQLPIFMCKELQSVQVVPVFLHPADLSATWMKAGGTEENLPKNLAMMDVRMLVKEMQLATSPWELIHFVNSPEAIKLSQELAKANKPTA